MPSLIGMSTCMPEVIEREDRCMRDIKRGAFQIAPEITGEKTINKLSTELCLHLQFHRKDRT
jgi:hypothetical protein